MSAQPPKAQPQPGPPSPPIVRPRALIVGGALILIVVCVTQSVEVVGNYPGLAQGPYASNYPIPFPVLCALLALLGINRLSRWRCGQPWLRHQELLAIYVMSAVGITAGSAMFGSGILEVMGVVHGRAFLQGGPTPALELLSPLLPQRLTVSDPRLLGPLYTGGGAPPLSVVVLGLGPLLLLWALFMALIGLMLYAVAGLFSRRWILDERLAYPVAQLPLTVVGSTATLTRSPLFWMAVLIAVVLHSVNGATRLFPSLPQLQVVHYADYLTTHRPWTSAWPIVISLSLSTIGIGFFVPTEVLFSAWFFVWVGKAALVVANALGFGEPNIYHGAPYVTEHSYGAYLTLTLYVPWLGRLRLRHLLRGVRTQPLDQSARATVNLLLGAAVLVTLFTHYLVGLSWWAAILFVGLFLAFSLGLARVRAQAGPPDPGLSIGQGDALMRVALGPHLLGPRNVVGLSLYLNTFTRWGQRNPIGAMADGLRMRAADAAGWRWAIPVALLVAIPAGLLINLHLYFRHGLGAQAFYWQGVGGHWLMDNTVGDLTSTQPWRPGPLLGVASGFLITSGLAALRTRFVGFPIHPIGLAVCAGYGMHHMWFSVFLAWAIKSSLVRWGGLRAWRAGLPFFAGLIVGEALMMAAWSGLNALIGTKCYTCTE